MDAKTKSRIDEVICRLHVCKNSLSTIMAGEQEYRDNLEVDVCEAKNYFDSDDAICRMGVAGKLIRQAIEYLNDLI